MGDMRAPFFFNLVFYVSSRNATSVFWGFKLHSFSKATTMALVNNLYSQAAKGALCKVRKHLYLYAYPFNSMINGYLN